MAGVETPQTLAARVQRAADRGTTITFVEGDGHTRVPWAELHDQARQMAAGLQAAGVGPGSHVALLGPTTRPLVACLQACWIAGAAAVVLPLPMRLGSLEEFVAQTRARIRAADAAIVVVDPSFAPFIEPGPGDPPMVQLDKLAVSEALLEEPTIDPASLAILQFTSGSTSDPKGVMLPNAAVCANLDAIAHGGHLVDDDVLVSWLPLYHDMGLIGLLGLGMTTGTEMVLAAPQDFLASPARWMQWMSDFGGTATAGPNFAYALSARALRRLDGLDLSRFRLGLNGAEPIDPDAVERYCEAGSRHGLDPGHVFPAFGMAESTLAVTFPEPGAGMLVDVVERGALENDRWANPVAAGSEGARRLARLGKPVLGLEIRIVDPERGAPIGERQVGELEVRGSSVMTGYYGRPDATEAVFREGGWLRTGDLGYLVDGELVVCGRIKDVIIVGGRNVFPEDVERAVATVDGVRAGNVIAFGVEGGRRGQESLVVVAEAKPPAAPEETSTGGPPRWSPGALRDAVAKRVRDAVGLPPREVVLVEPGTLPKTSSGKLQRSLCRARYLAEELKTA